MIRPSLATANIQRHLRRHNSHELNICLERQARHIGDRTRDVVHVDACLRLTLPLACRRPRAVSSLRVVAALPYVDLAAGDVVFTSIERQ